MWVFFQAHGKQKQRIKALTKEWLVVKDSRADWNDG